MPTFETLVAFVVVSMGLVVLPGPSNVFIFTHGIGHGQRAALAAVSGIAAASAIRVVLTAAGLSAVLASSAFAFNVIRWAGVAYLLYLGVMALRSHGNPIPVATGKRLPPTRDSFRKGLVVGLGNPKMVLFFVAFFPQFIDADRGSAVVQMLLLGTVFWLIGTAWDVGCAVASGSLGAWLRRRPRIQALRGRAESSAYFGLAAWTALSSDRARH